MTVRSVYRIFITSLLVVTVLGVTSLVGGQPVSATVSSCQSKIDSCPTANIKIDFSCQRAQLVNPSSQCCVSYCALTAGTTQTYYSADANILNVNFFGINLHFNSANSIAQMVLLGFSIFLAVIALFLLSRAVYASYLRAKADDAADASKAFKLIQNSVVGFVIIAIAIVIVQLVASFAGVGSITEIIDFTEFFNRSGLSSTITVSCPNGGDPGANCL